jgi:hypothetical protein
MNIFEAERVVICSLIKQGAFCRTETIQNGMNNIIATWKSTFWRILVKTTEKDAMAIWPSIEEIKMFQEKATANSQTLVVAYVNADSNIIYKAADDGRVIRPRCIIKLKKADDVHQNVFKELHK